MRIALVTPRYLPEIGGVEVHVGHLARRLAAADHSVDVLTQATPSDAALDRADGATVRRFPTRLGGRTYPFAPGLWRYIGRHSLDYDVVHVHSYHATPAIPAALAPTRRLVFTPHYLGGGRTAIAQAIHRPYRSVGRVLFRRADHVICTTVAEARTVASHFPDAALKTIVIPNGVDVELINSAARQQSSGPVVLYAGRLERYKNVQLIVDAVPYLGDELRLVVVGDGPSSSDLALLAADLGVASRVQFVGGRALARRLRLVPRCGRVCHDVRPGVIRDVAPGSSCRRCSAGGGGHPRPPRSRRHGRGRRRAGSAHGRAGRAGRSPSARARVACPGSPQGSVMGRPRRFAPSALHGRRRKGA